MKKSRIVLFFLIGIIFLLSGLAKASNWRSIGPNGGWADSIAFRPGDPQTVYAGGDTYGGFYISRDGGRSWTRNPAYGDHNAWCLTVDSESPDLVYAGSMMDTNIGIRKSSDGGMTWKTVLASPNVASIRLDPENHQILYAAAGFWGANYQPSGHGAGVWKSVDGGENWIQVGGQSMADLNVMDVEVHPANSSALLAAVYDPFTNTTKGIFASLDSGNTWFRSGLEDKDVWRLVPLPGSPGTVFAVTWQGIYRSNDFGGNWSQLNLDGSLFLSLAVADNDPDTMLAVSISDGAFKSSNGGTTWAAVQEGLPSRRCWNLAAVPGTPNSFMLTQMGQGIYLTTDSGNHWQVENAGFRCHYGFDLAMDGSGDLLCGFYNEVGNDMSSAWRWNGTSWAGLGNTGDRMIRAIGIDPSDPQTLFISDLTEDMNGGTSGGTLQKSTDGGTSWQTVGAGLPDSVTLSVISVVPDEPAVIYGGTANGSAYQGGDGVWKSTDGGQNWTFSGLSGRQISTIYLKKPDGSSLLAATTTGLFQSTDSGASWEEMPALSGLPLLTMTVDPTDTQTIYVGLYSAGVWKSTDGGVSFSPTALKDRSVTGLAVDPAHPATVFACGSENIQPGWGVLRSDDGGENWQEFSEGLVNHTVSHLLIDPDKRTLYASTLGYGVYARPIDGAADTEHQGLPVFHIAAGNYWTTQLNVLNGDGRDHLTAFTATGDNGLAFATVERLLPANGELISSVRDLFPSADAGGIRKITVSPDRPDARIAAFADYRFQNGDEESSVGFTEVHPAKKLLVDHITHNAMWWTGIALTNLRTDTPVDVYFRANDGTVTLYKSGMAPGERASFLMSDLLGTEHTVDNVEFLSYLPGSTLLGNEITGTAVDALGGIEVFGQRIQSHGLSEGFRLVGEWEGGNGYDTRFLIPLHIPDHAAALHQTTGIWDGVSVTNPSDSTLNVTIHHYGPDGILNHSVIKTVDGNQKLVFVPEDMGFDSSLGGYLDISCENPATSFFLTGDLADTGGRSFMGGGRSIGGTDFGLRFQVPAKQNSTRSSLISILNPGTETATVTIQALPVDGRNDPIATKVMSLPPNGSSTLDMTSLVSTDYEGILLVTSDHPIGVFDSEYTTATDKEKVNLLGRKLTAVPRSMAMGFTPFPYDVTPEALSDTYDFITTHGDLIAEHFDEGVPWPEALTDTPYSDNLTGEVAGRLAKLDDNHKVYVAVTPLASDRHSLANYWGTEKNSPLPPEWVNKKLDDPDVIAAYTNFCRYMITAFHPDYMNYGIEVNLGFTENDPEFPRLLTLLKQVYTTLKSENPDLPLFVSLVIGSNIAGTEEEARINRQILQYSDYVAISTYPYMGPGLDGSTGNPDKIPADWFASVAALAPDKPFAVAETGYQAETLDIPELGVHIPCTPEWQDQYVSRLMVEADRLDANFLVWFVSRDYDRMWAVLEQQGISPIAKAWKDNGLLDGDGTPRPALTTWDNWHDLSFGRSR